VTLDIEKGEIFGLFGRMEQENQLYIDPGDDLQTDLGRHYRQMAAASVKKPDAVKKMIGFVPQDIALYPCFPRGQVLISGRGYTAEGKAQEREVR
jgi:ABC-type multidrug transport system ATPase subunit